MSGVALGLLFKNCLYIKTICYHACMRNLLHDIENTIENTVMFSSIFFIVIYCNVQVNVHIQNVMLVKLDLILERFVFTHFIESNVV